MTSITDPTVKIHNHAAPQWLEQASDHLVKAWAALDVIGATAELARLEQVIVEVDALRLAQR